MAAAMCAAAADDTTLEVYVFGKSYHTNRSYDWNEENYGLGIGLAKCIGEDSPNTDVFGVVGSYKDSLNETAKFALFGIRGVVLGQKNDYHATLSFAGGYYEGSGFVKFGILPVFSIGYDKFDLCFTGSPNVLDSNDKYNTAMIAVFLKMQVMEF